MQSERSLIPTPMPVRRHARSGNRGLALTALCLAVLLVVMDNTIVNVAIPTMSDALNASSTDLQWVVDAYTLSFAALLLPAGKLSDRWGRRRMLLVGLAGFAVVSAATAFSWALWQLVTLRVVLGVCAALIYPATLSSIIVIFEGSRYRSLAVGLWAATSGVGIALGPIIGGVLLEHYAWNSIFGVGSVIGAVALACIAVAVPEVRAYRSERFDFPGTVLSVAGAMMAGLLVSAGVGLLVWAIIERPTYGWLSWQVIGGICAALIILAVFAAVEGHTHAPLIDVGLFRRATFTSSTCAICVAFFCLFGFIFITTQWFQALRGYTALQTAVATLPFAVVMAAVAPLATQLAKRFGYRSVVSTGLLFLSASMFVVTRVDAHCSYWFVVVPTMALMAAGIALIQGPATDALMSTVPESSTGAASAVNDTIREIGGTLGVAVMGSAISSVYPDELSDSLSRLQIPSSIAKAAEDSVMAAKSILPHLPAGIRQTVEQSVSTSFMSATHAACWIACALALAFALLCWITLPKHDSGNLPQ